uniref:Uncharacterized protein n=1 Tax=viral metagenome TaxID=1070528 RepID=A0A6M3KVY2_9ZZZZ
MGRTDLDNHQYDNWLAKNKKEKELRERHRERQTANKGYEGFHFGLGDKPVYTRDKDEFKRELAKRGLMMRDDVKRDLK